MENILDTYFLNAKYALTIAKQKQYLNPYCLQLCYYGGSDRIDGPENFIHLPFEEFVAFFKNSQFRMPQIINFNESHLLELEKINMTNLFLRRKEEVEYNRTLKLADARKLIQNMKIDSDNENIRVYLNVEKNSGTVTQITRNLAKTFECFSCNVLLDIVGELEEISEHRRAEAIAKFKPHISISINRLRNSCLPDETYHFIWFTDPTLILYDDTQITYRDRDKFIFSGYFLKDQLLRKGVPEEIMIYYPVPAFVQSHSDYRISNEREDKIVFIGSNYYKVDNLCSYYEQHKVNDELKNAFVNGVLNGQYLLKLANEFKNTINFDRKHLELFIYPAFIRKMVVEWMCQQPHIKQEVYGRGWEENSLIAPYYKGELNYGDELNKVYKSSKYVVSAHSSVFYLIKLFEISAYGATPVVFEPLFTKEPFYHRNSVLMFNSEDTLSMVLQKRREVSNPSIHEDYSYNKLVSKLLNLSMEYNKIMER